MISVLRPDKSQTQIVSKKYPVLPRVDIVMTSPGMDPAAIRAFVREGTEGLVIVSLGNGEYPKVIEPAL